MEIRKETKIKITLTLNEEEATWLKGYVQNAFYEPEAEIDTIMRKEIFDNLYAQGIR